MYLSMGVNGDGTFYATPASLAVSDDEVLCLLSTWGTMNLTEVPINSGPWIELVMGRMSFSANCLYSTEPWGNG